MMRDYLTLWGGADIHPSIYGEQPLEYSGPFNRERDKEEIALYKEYLAAGKPIIGVCRGAQLLCALNGGRLYQHVPQHRNNSHGLICSDGSVIKSAAADHHQVMQPVGNYVLLAWDDKPAQVYSDNGFFSIFKVPEVVYWPDTKCLGIQPHPEWEQSNSEFVKYCNKLCKDLFDLEEVF